MVIELVYHRWHLPFFILLRVDKLLCQSPAGAVRGCGYGRAAAPAGRGGRAGRGAAGAPGPVRGAIAALPRPHRPPWQVENLARALTAFGAGIGAVTDAARVGRSPALP